MAKGKMTKAKAAPKLQKGSGIGPSMKGPVAGGMSGRPKSESSSVYGKPRSSTKDCY